MGCPSARKAVKFYAGRIAYWHKMGAVANQTRASERPRGSLGSKQRGCPRYLAHVLQRKARAAHKAYIRWAHEWRWQDWLPAKFYRVARCETGVRWDWDSRQYDAQGHYVGGYVSAFGIYWPAYEAYHHWTGQNTPREQYEVAAAIQRRFGWAAWGCGNA